MWIIMSLQPWGTIEFKNSEGTYAAPNDFDAGGSIGYLKVYDDREAALKDAGGDASRLTEIAAGKANDKVSNQ